jgi:hypothetical protein
VKFLGIVSDVSESFTQMKFIWVPSGLKENSLGRKKEIA